MDKKTAKLEQILSKINKMLDRHIQVQEENIKLRQENNDLKTQLEEQSKKIQHLEKEMKSVLVAKSIGENEEDKQIVKKKINEFIREIDKCIGMLNN